MLANRSGICDANRETGQCRRIGRGARHASRAALDIGISHSPLRICRQFPRHSDACHKDGLTAAEREELVKPRRENRM
jgi:hypothetical protein